MKAVTIATVATLTDQSERTLRRRIADGSLPRLADDGGNRTMIPFESIHDQIVIPMEAEDRLLIGRADAGEAEAQNDLALLFLANGKPEIAIYWLEMAAKQDYPEAMHWLGRCHMEGRGLAKDDNLGMMWLSKAAAHGHEISQAQMQAMRDRFIQKS